MLSHLFLSVLERSLSMGCVIALLLVLSPFLSRRYAMKWKNVIWAVIALYLILPVSIHPQMFYRVRIALPVQMTMPVENRAPEKEPAGEAKAPVLREGKASFPVSEEADAGSVSFSLLDGLAIFWLAGVVLFLAVHLVSFWHYAGRIRKNGLPVRDDAVTRQLRRVAQELGLTGPVTVIQYQEAGSPMVLGLFRPVVVLPAVSYGEEELYFILKHEAVHIRRRDIFWKMLFVAANALHWFHPLVYRMRQEAVIDLEMSCDERVIRQSDYEVRKAYTETLFATLDGQLQKGSPFTTQFYGGKTIMKKRFQNILGRKPKRNGALVCVLIVTLTLTMGMLVGCSREAAAEKPAAQEREEQQAAQEQAAEQQAAQEQATERLAAKDMRFLAYITQVGQTGSEKRPSLTLDDVTWVEIPSAEADALGLTEDDGPGGFVVYNPESTTETFPLAADCEVMLLNWQENFVSIPVSVEELLDTLQERGEQNEGIPYHIEISKGEIVRIVEQYVP